MGNYSSCNSWCCYKKDGSSVLVSIGDDLNDPVVGISDLLVHLAVDQLQKQQLKLLKVKI